MKFNSSHWISEWNNKLATKGQEREYYMQLRKIQILIAEACEHGFNPLEGQWAEELFKSNAATHRLLTQGVGKNYEEVLDSIKGVHHDK